MKKNNNHLPFDDNSDRHIQEPRYTSPTRTSDSRTRNKKKKAPWGLIGLSLLLIVAASFLIKSLSHPDPVESTKPQTSTSENTGSQTQSETTGSTTATTQPPPSPTPVLLSAEARAAAIDAAGQQVLDLIKQQPASRVSVYFLNLSGMESWSYEDDVPFVAASSIKIGFNTRLYTLIADGSISPDEVLTYDSRPYPTGDYEAGTGTIQSLPNGSTLTVRETSGLSIRISDNCGTNMVIRRLGGIDTINPWLNGISGTIDYRQKVTYTNYAGQQQSGRHRTCARDLGQMAVYLYEHWVEQPVVFDPLIDDLSHTEFDFGIQKGIPDQVQVAHKIGTNGIYSTENDVGIVFTEEPFVLCVMTEMADAVKAHQLQAEIASIFYNCTFGWPFE